MRDFEGFCMDVEREIGEYLPSSLDVDDIRIQNVEKPNLGTRAALSVRLEGQVAAPLIYMDRFYDMYQAGMPEDEVMSRIADETAGALKEIPIIPDYMNRIDSWDTVKDHLIIDAMGVSQNRDRLPDTAAEEGRILHDGILYPSGCCQQRVHRLRSSCTLQLQG